jgi:sec-independent protein translocase protein TatA
MGHIGTTELLIILGIVLIFVGAKKLPELAQGVGKGIREFRKASRELDEDREIEAVQREKDNFLRLP